MITHNLQLTTIPFEAIKAGQKTIESRLYDEKRQRISLGDTLIFTNREDESQTLRVTVIGLHRHATFHELFSHNDPVRFGGASVEWLESQINGFYNTEAQRENGVIGIEFKLF